MQPEEVNLYYKSWYPQVWWHGLRHAKSSRKTGKSRKFASTRTRKSGQQQHIVICRVYLDIVSTVETSSSVSGRYIFNWWSCSTARYQQEQWAANTLWYSRIGTRRIEGFVWQYSRIQYIQVLSTCVYGYLYSVQSNYNYVFIKKTALNVPSLASTYNQLEHCS